MPPIVSLVGKANSGKTTLLEKLIPELVGRGFKIGTIKHHVHEFDMDKPGKDTWRHKKAGARVVALSSPNGVGIIRDTDRDLSLNELANQYFHDVDLIITEGYKRASAPKFEIFRSSIHDAPLDERDDTWVAMISDKRIQSGLATFDLNDINGLASFLVNTFIYPLHPDTISLRIGDKCIDLPPHQKSHLAKALAGVLPEGENTASRKSPITITINNV